jgi:hypothetical protein
MEQENYDFIHRMLNIELDFYNQGITGWSIYSGSACNDQHRRTMHHAYRANKKRAYKVIGQLKMLDYFRDK